MKLGHFLEYVDTCSVLGQHCALSRTINDGCIVMRKYPTLTLRSFGDALIERWKPTVDEGAPICIRLTERGHNIRKQLKGDFT